MRKFLILMMSVITLSLAAGAQARDITGVVSQAVTDRSIMSSGDYYWNDDSSVTGAVSVRVNLVTQMAYVLRGDTLIGVTNVSSGRETFETPTGSFVILGKEDNHWSKKYKANMPWTMWLTNDGVALHSGGTPGKPSSHGCVHLPPQFAQHLYQVAARGATVEITSEDPTGDLGIEIAAD